MKLLIVEDSDLVSRRLKKVLEAVPHLETEVAESYLGGLSRFGAYHPDLVVLDLDLGDGNGLDLLREIKRAEPATRVLMFTNHAFCRQRCVAEGADYFFDKSADFEALTRTVTHLAEEQA